MMLAFSKKTQTLFCRQDFYKVVVILFLKKYIRVPHKQPEGDCCPRCDSPLVALMFKSNNIGRDDSYITKSHLVFGELAYPSNFDEGYNCTCLACGIKWKATLQTRWVTLSELEQIKKEKGITTHMINHFKNRNEDIKKEVKAEKKKARKAKRQKLKKKLKKKMKF